MQVGNVSSNKLRDSNIELLRILCMLGVLLNHIIQDIWGGAGGDSICANLVMDISVIGVNCFVLISGYYSIRLTVKSFLSLYFLCAFYSVGCALYAYIYQDIGTLALCKSIFALSENNWWFIKAYVGLMLIAPLLNVATKAIDNNKLLINIIFLTVLNVYFGYMHQIDEINQSGYNLMQFIYVYLIGTYLSRCANTRSGLYYLSIWVATVCAMAVLYYIKIKFNSPYVAIFYSLKYNSPAVLIASISFFMFIASYKFTNRFINWIAISILPVYLIHQNMYMGSNFETVLRHISQFDGLLFLLQTTAIIIIYFIVCVAIDKMRIAICTPATNYLVSKIQILSNNVMK